MKKETSSNTADAMALSRAIESLKPEEQRVCYDPYAKDFLTLKYKIFTIYPLLRSFCVGMSELIFWGHHYYVVARTRYIDDYLADCLCNNIEQLVILGAGYDSRAYRFEKLKNVKVFEVDHSATQKEKQRKVKKIFGTMPSHVTYVSVDFLAEKLGDKLYQHGYNPDCKTLFIWEGTTPYLSQAAVDETLSFISNHSGMGSSIIFDYTLQSYINGTSEYTGAKWEMKFMSKTSEPVTFGVNKEDIVSFLEKRGFSNITDCGADDFKTAYWGNSHSKRRIKQWWRIVHATTEKKKSL